MFVDVDGNVVSHDDPYGYVMVAFGIGCRIVDIHLRYPDDEWQVYECVTLSRDIECVEDVLGAVGDALGVDDRELV
jgi:hypothetical protein